jgi:hypothetical protein
MSDGDPWSDPLPALKRIDQEIQQNSAVARTQQLALDQYNSLWINATASNRNGGILSALGAELRLRGYRFWLDAWLSIMRRAHIASKKPRPNPDDLLCAVVANLLIKSIERDERAIESALNEIYETAVPSALCRPFQQAQYHLNLWCQPSEYPPTPHVNRQELITAARDMDGMSEANVCKKLQKGIIEVEEQKGALARFRHSDDAVQLEILRAVVGYLAES